MKSRVGQLAFAVIIVVMTIALLYAAREGVLTVLGRMLVNADAPSHADIIVVVRGDETRFDRSLTAADLFFSGFANRVFVSSALNDAARLSLAKRGMILRTPQENIARVLLQRGVPCEKIVLDGSAPGGGTLGEAKRLASFMAHQQLSTALIVTSWFHSRRTKSIMESVLGTSGAKATVVIAKSQIGPQNWWTFRYDAVIVLEEFVKLALHFTIGRFEFRDDPQVNAAVGGPAIDACGMNGP